MNVASLVRRFERSYDNEWEADAALQLQEFNKNFPLSSLKKLTLEDYAIGRGRRDTYCYWLESGTRDVALIAGSSATKFGVYYGVSKKDPKKRYRYTKHFRGALPETGAEKEVFKGIKAHLLDLIRAGASLDFSAIDANPFSQMIKAKVLALHFPDKYVAICSKDRLRALSTRLQLGTNSCAEIQHKALLWRSSLAQAASWSQFKYTDFLFTMVLGTTGPAALGNERAIKKPRNVDFRKLMEMWARVGKESEEIAWKHEQQRLRKAGFANLIPNMVDYTSKPTMGYDFLSHTSEQVQRFIEVKTFTEVRPGEYRFFLSHNEKERSQSQEHAPEYYFYLVMFDSEGNVRRKRVKEVKASDFYKEVAAFEPQGFVLRWTKARLP